MITARHVTRYRGGHAVIERVDLSINADSRIGVVGRNGIGKTTLLRVLAGLDQPDEGRVLRTPDTVTVGYLPQEPDTEPEETLAGYLGRRTGVTAAQGEMERLARAMAADGEADEAYSLALDRYLALGGADLEARAGAVCADVGLAEERLDQPMGTFSGGQAARAALAAVLLSRFDVFLLDEPTNNLDYDGLTRLEQFLADLTGAIVVVSHDRAFLETTVDRVVEIEESTHRVREYGGGFTEYLRMREEARQHQYEAHARFTEERDRLSRHARRQRQWAEQNLTKVKKDPDDPDKHIRTRRLAGAEKLMARAKTVERRVERLDTVDKPWEGWRLQMSLAPSGRSGDVVVRLDGAVAERGPFRLGPLELEITWAERVGLLGPNGVGKSTLIDVIGGRLPLAGGARYVGPSVVMGELDQPRRAFSGTTTLIDSFVRQSGLLAEAARSLLAKFDLAATDVERPAETLSAGERTRAALALLMAAEVNCLVLDEPTNHLDLPAIEQLEAALQAYDGTVILVTHDRRLLENVALTRTIRLG